jgi:hypothetical protein
VLLIIPPTCFHHALYLIQQQVLHIM